jgi:hypothetical protein
MSATNSIMATPSNACRIVVRCASGDVGRLPKRRIGAQQFHLDGLAVARRNLSRTLRRQPAYFIELFPLNLVGRIQAWVAG